ncbi:MAG: hypothetical protein Satyrvirus2_5 [Satyrvirus sp.]|uniref:Uncharacterized protein n=1 Tax=Satyrvirus sp. TaxID=2487771 RepID=A0A3G5AEH4_9VIRU|nr:MAG: hypothetical protein Satyrvirus2_5 [Satyrvirus sp.]
MTKIKNKKNTLVKQKKGTLDKEHTDCINRFEKMNKSIPSKKEKLLKLEIELNNLINLNPNKCTHQDIGRKAYLRDTINKLRSDICSIENCSDSLNYISNTLPILINYYDNKEIIDDGIEEFVNDSNDFGKKNILSYFMKETSNPQPDNSLKKISEKSVKVSKKKRSTNENLDSNITNDNEEPKKINRAKLYDNYLNAIDINHRQPSQYNKIDICNIDGCDGEKILSQSDGYMVCKKCGHSEIALMSVDKPNYKEPTQDSGTYAYKRINHLTEILSQLQAKESTDIPPKVFESILRELKKRKIDKNDLDIFKLRRILKKLDYRKYYEHVPHILQIINGKEPPNFSRKDEMKIKKMFKDVQEPFKIYCPKNRKNFLNYSYVLHKFCELLDLDEYINYFPLLKNNTKLLQHDRIWKNICEYMKWEYYKSI